MAFIKVALVLALLVLPNGCLCFFLDHIFEATGYRVGDEYYDVCQDTCRLTLTCWLLSGQVVKGHLCGSSFHVCCAEPSSAEARKMEEGSGQNSLQQEWPEVKFGPVINEPECGLTPISRRRVVGGDSAGFGTFPWQALIRVKSSRCGGALVGPRHVVTAGHCVNPLGEDLPTEGVTVYLGEYYLADDAEPLPTQEFGVEKIHLHPYYEFTPQADRFDVAVLKLDAPAVYDVHVRPVCLPARDADPSPGTLAMVAGWGATRANSGRRPRELQAVDVKVVESPTCEQWHASNRINLKIFNDMMCAGHEEGGKDACQGDSGGPLMTRESGGRWTLIGLVSAGYSCAKPGQPGIYHKLSKTSDWVSYVISHL